MPGTAPRGKSARDALTMWVRSVHFDRNGRFKRAFDAGVRVLAVDETRGKLIEAAGHEFAEKGFDGATVRSICERAGANLAAVNYHFGDKEGLYVAVVMVAHESRPAVAAAHAGGGDDPGAGLRRFVAHFLEEAVFQQQTPWHQAIMMREIVAPSRASDRLIREAFRPRFEVLLGLLRRLAPGADEPRLHAIAFSVIGQCLHYKSGRSISERIVGAEAYGRLGADYLIDHITRFTLAALGRGEPLGQPGATPRGGR